MLFNLSWVLFLCLAVRHVSSFISGVPVRSISLIRGLQQGQRNHDKFSDVRPILTNVSLIECASTLTSDLSLGVHLTTFTNAFKYNTDDNVCTLGRIPSYYGGQVHQDVVQAVAKNVTDPIYLSLNCLPKMVPIPSDRLLYLPLLQSDVGIYNWNNVRLNPVSGSNFRIPFINGDVTYYKNPNEAAGPYQAGSLWWENSPRIPKPRDFSAFGWYHNNGVHLTYSRVIVTVCGKWNAGFNFRVGGSAEWENRIMVIIYNYNQYNLYVATEATIPHNKWVHLGFTYYKPTGRVTMYQNGKQVGNVINAGPITLSDLYAVYPGFWQYYWGLDATNCRCNLAHIEIYSRALSAHEVLQVYNRHLPDPSCPLYPIN